MTKSLFFRGVGVALILTTISKIIQIALAYYQFSISLNVALLSPILNVIFVGIGALVIVRQSEQKARFTWTIAYGYFWILLILSNLDLLIAMWSIDILMLGVIIFGAPLPGVISAIIGASIGKRLRHPQQDSPAHPI